MTQIVTQIIVTDYAVVNIAFSFHPTTCSYISNFEQQPVKSTATLSLLVLMIAVLKSATWIHEGKNDL